MADTGDARYRFLARFGATIVSGGIAAMPMALYHYQAELALTPQEVWFVGYILAHRWTAALPYPSLRRMSRRTGISAQMLHRYKQSLIENGYLATIPRHRPSGGRTSNYYDFSGLFQQLELLLLRDRRGGDWQPSADDSDTLDGDPGDEGGAGDDLSAHQVPAPTVPASQRLPAPKRPAPDQPALSGGRQPELVGGEHRYATAVEQPGAAAPGNPGDALHIRVTGEHNRIDPPAEAGRWPVHAGGEEGGTSDDAAPGTEKRALRAGIGTLAVVTVVTGDDPPESGRWWQARRQLAGTLSAAAFHAWIEPLAVVDAPASDAQASPADGTAGADAGASAGADAGLLVLGCRSAFQRDHVLRHYRAAIEAAAGGPVTLVVLRAPAAPSASA